MDALTIDQGAETMPDINRDEKETRVTVLFPPPVAQRLRRVAERKAVPFSVLARLWVIEKLDEEERRLGIEAGGCQ